MAPAGSKNAAAADGSSAILSKQCEEVLRGASFDARAFLKRTRTTGDAAQDEEELGRFRAKLKIVDMLNHFPEHCLTTQQRLQDDIQGLSTSAQRRSKTDDVFDKSCRKVGKIDAEWRGAFLAKTFGVLGLDLGAIKDLDKVCSDTLSQVFDVLVGTTPDTAITDEMRDKVLCDRVFAERANTLGRATKKWVKALLESKGSSAPDWSKLGCFSLAGTAGGAWTVKHCSGAEVSLPKHLNITGTVRLLDNFGDSKARLIFEGSTQPVYLAPLFEGGVGPNLQALVNGKGHEIKRISQEKHRELVEERAKVTDTSGYRVEAVISEVLHEHKREALQARMKAHPAPKPKMRASRFSLVTGGGA